MKFKKVIGIISILLSVGSVVFISFVFVISIMLSNMLNSGSNNKTSDGVIADMLTKEMILEAISSQEKYKVPASIILAQILLESRGKYPLPNGKYSRLAYEDKNLFGIKGKGDAGSRAYETGEYTSDGKAYKIKANFAKYSSYKASIDAHGKLLSSPLYKNRVKDENSPEAWADALTGLYATAPDYGDKLKEIMRSNDLYRFNSMKKGQALKLFNNNKLAKGLNGASDMQKNIVQSATSYSDPFRNGYRYLCEKWVGDVYEKSGLSYQRSHCASFARERFATKKGDIPVGAIVYSSESYRAGVRCFCGRDAGHVGIYIGNGRVLSSQPNFNVSLEEFINNVGYGGYSFNMHKLK